RPLGGKPLVAWCLEALQRAASVPRVVVATDCDLIERVVRGLGLGKVEIYRRSAASATDTAPTEAVVLEWLAREPLADGTTFVLVQATSPLVTAADFDTALRTFWLSGADSLLSCVRTKRFFWRPDGTPVNYDPARRP